MNLQPFCSREEFTRPYLMKPFSIGEWTYATNGHICVRVPRLGDVPDAAEPKLIKNVPALFEGMPTEGFNPLPKITIEADEDEECLDCDGRGTEHDCDYCKCVCAKCEGTGHPVAGYDVSVGISGAIFSGVYIAQLLTLPKVTMTEPCKEVEHAGKCKAAYFRFDGGEGALMEMRSPNGTHIDTSELAA